MIRFSTARPKIAIFRALQLGDLLCSIPAVRGLRQAFPQAEIVWIGLPWTPNFVQRFAHYIDRCIIFPGYPGLPEQEWNADAWEVFVEQMKEEAFDLIIQLHGNGSIVNAMLQQLGAKQLAGYHRPDCYMDPAWFMEYPDYGHEINRHIHLMEFLGISCQGPELEFPITPEEEAALHELIALQPDEQYVCIHPGSRGAWRQWPPEYFAALADVCARAGYTVFITGTQDELPITQQVQAHMQELNVNLAGKTNLGVAGALIRQASLLISNCTGVAHIAAALHTPSLVISMDGEPERWGALDHHLHKTIDWTKNDLFENVEYQLREMLRLQLAMGDGQLANRQ
jgi:ADP-heptose:LPS heptosyltransferase